MRALSFAALTSSASAIFFFQDMKPKSYKNGSVLDIHAGQLWSKRSSVPFDFYKLKWCPSTAGHEYDPSSIGVALRDMEITETPYSFEFGTNQHTEVSCNIKYEFQESVQFRNFILHEFNYQLYLDGLPSAVKLRDPKTGELQTSFEDGIPVGYFDEDETAYFVYNHLHIEVEYAQNTDDKKMQIVSFEVEPRSIAKGQLVTWDYTHGTPAQEIKGGYDVEWSYSIMQYPGETTWAHRMDHYYKIGSTKVHWMQICCTLFFVACLSIFTFSMLKLGLNADARNMTSAALQKAERRKQRISGAMEIESSTTVKASKSSDVAWKKLHDQVFRTPLYPVVFSALLGAGTQIFMMFYLTLSAFAFFFTADSLRPPIYFIIMSVLSAMGFINGLITTRVLKFFGVTDWLFAAAISSMGLPIFLYACLFSETILYLIAGGYSKQGLLYSFLWTAAWLTANSLTCFVGAFKGYMMERVKQQAKVSSIVRKIPDQPSWLNIVFVMIFFGGIQYLAICVEFSAIIASLWRSKLYSLFGFLLVDVILLIIVIGLLGVIQCYAQLQNGNYRWWWRSFWTGASGGIYLAIYSVVYLFAEMDVSNLDSDLVYLFYMFLFITCYMLMAGAISVASSYIFVEHLYTGIRGD